MKKNIFITGGRSFVALELARGFHKSGCSVYVGDSLTRYICQYSNAVTKHFHLPSPTFSFSEFQEKLVVLCKEFQIDVLIPTCEEVFYVAKAKLVLERQGVFVMTSALDFLEKLHHKYLFTTISPKSPTSFLIESQEDLKKHSYNKKMVLKPVYSRFGEEVKIGMDFSSIDLQNKSWVLQEYVSGTQICTYAYGENGKLKWQICYQNQGKSTRASTVFSPYQDKILEDMVREFLQTHGYTGHVSFDIIESDGKYYFIECNPRVTSGIHNLAGNDFKELFFDEVKDLVLEKKKLFFATAIYQPQQLFKSLDAPDVVFHKKDIKPFLAQNLCLFSCISLSMREKISLIHSTTFDIEYNGGKL
ncbi:MAG: ATP-grasp domain-containing protein [Eubacteriales bacterium]